MTKDRDGNVVVVTPIRDTPAERNDIKPGDIIEKVNGEECKSLDIDVVSNKIKGKENTEVNLEISRNGEIINKTITRKKVIIPYVESEILEENIGYIKIISFDGNSSTEFEKQFKELKSRGIKSLIIDVRNNGGGLVSKVKEIAEFILPENKIIMKEIDRNGKETEAKTKNKDKIDMEIVLLVNEHSASASEILTACLKDNNAAKIVGKTTYGKGVMQEVIQLSSGDALKITIEEFLTPNGDKINKVGIKPDYEVEQDVQVEQDLQLQKAIELLK